MSALDLALALPAPKGARGFLATLRVAGGQVRHCDGNADLASACRRAGLCHIADDGMVKLTGLGQAYLDRIARAE